MSFPFYIIRWYFLVLIVISIISGGFAYYSSSAALEEKLKETINFELAEKKSNFEKQIELLKKQALVLASNGSVKAFTQSNPGSIDRINWISIVNQTFLSQIHNSELITQIRLIDRDSGNELVRVERKEEQAFAVKRSELQNKGRREYVRKALWLAPGEVFFSEINLNRENGKISIPQMPVLRIVTPVNNNDVAGSLLVLNVDFSSMIEYLTSSFPWSDSRVYVLNEKLHYLYHPEPKMRFNFELSNNKDLISTHFPNEAELLSLAFSNQAAANQTLENLVPAPSSFFHLSDENGWFNAITLLDFGKNKDKQLGIIIQVPKTVLSSDLAMPALYSALMTLAIIVLGGALLFVITVRISRPIHNLTRVMRTFYGKANTTLKFQKSIISEFNQLQESFTEMSSLIDQKTAQLEAEKKPLAAVLETAAYGIFIINDQGQILRLNPAFCKLFGYSAFELYETPIRQIIPELKSCDLANSDKTSGGIDLQGVDKNGHSFSFHLTLSHFQIDGHKYCTGMIHDLTEMVLLTKELKESNLNLERKVTARTSDLMENNKLLRAEIKKHSHTQAKLFLANQVMANARQAVCITDEKNHIIDVNDAFIEMTGFSREFVIGKPPSISKSGRHDKGFYQAMWQSLAEIGHWEGEIWDRRFDGTLYPKYMTIDKLDNDQGETVNYVAMFEDLTEKKATEAELEQLTHYDSLTGLANGSFYRHQLSSDVKLADRMDKKVAVILINLDRFKDINDSLGYLVGDKLIQLFSERLKKCIEIYDTISLEECLQPKSDKDFYTLSRLNGDRFAIILNDLEQGEDATRIINDILIANSNPFHVGENDVFLAASMGIAVYPDNTDKATELTLLAERALNIAKSKGGNTFEYYSEEMNRNSFSQIHLESDLRQAIKNEEFVLYYQPKYRLDTLEIIGMEALVRWKRPILGFISPSEFIPLAEATGLIVPLGEWILKQACADTKAINSQLGMNLTVSVNLSPRQFQSQNIINTVKDVLETTLFPPNQLDLEITESMVMKDVFAVINTMHSLRELGVSLSIDDFGTGYSSLSYLKQFPVTSLKIDQSFIRNMSHGSADEAIVSSICNLGQQLKMQVVAEGIEKGEQLEFLRGIQCQQGQGFLMSKPLSAENLAKMLSPAFKEYSIM